MDEETVLYLGISGILLILLLTIGYGHYSLLVLILVLITTLFIVLLNYADFLIFPAFTHIFGISVMLSKDHIVPKSQNVVIKYANSLYYATGYLTANIYSYVFKAENIATEDEANMAAGPEKWERIVMNVGFPFKYCVIATAKDLQKYREELEGQRGYIEFQLSKEESAQSPNSLAMREMQRKINVIQARIDRISTGELPVTSIMYIETTAIGVSEKEAADALTNQLNHLETVFNAFDLSINRVVGRELHMLHQLNYRLLDPTALGKLFQAQK